MITWLEEARGETTSNACVFLAPGTKSFAVKIHFSVSFFTYEVRIKQIY